MLRQPGCAVPPSATKGANNRLTPEQRRFFLGPLFPAAVVAATKSLPKHLHVSTIGFAAAFGGGGAAVLPFAVGAIAQSKGVGVLQPFILSLLGVQLLLWLALPRFSKKRD